MDLPFCFSIDKLCFAASGHITLHRYQTQIVLGSYVMLQTSRTNLHLSHDESFLQSHVMDGS
jgi:hypothetical protein